LSTCVVVKSYIDKQESVIVTFLEGRKPSAPLGSIPDSRKNAPFDMVVRTLLWIFVKGEGGAEGHDARHMTLIDSMQAIPN